MNTSTDPSKIRLGSGMASVIPERWPAPGRGRWGRGGTLLGSVSVHALVFAAIILAPLLAPPAEPETPTTIEVVMTDMTGEAVETAAEPDAATEAVVAAAERSAPDPTPPEPAAPPSALPPPEPTPPEPPPPVPEPPPSEPPPPEPQVQPEPPPAPEPLPEPQAEPEPPPPEPPPPETPPLPVPPPPPEPPRPAPPRPKPRPVAASARPAEPGPTGDRSAAPAAEQTAAAPAPPRISASWNAAVAAWLHRHKTYPQAARALGQQGSSYVRFTVARDGTVLEVHLTRGTGSAILDEAVRSLLTGARVPAFPAEMPHERVTVQVQISYTLDR